MSDSLTPGQTAHAATVERRRSIRFPLQFQIRYKILNRGGVIICGHGKTLNISSSGVLFLSEQPLPADTRAQLCIAWPVPLNERCLLNLLVRGRVIRAEADQAALRIERYEFRTQAATHA